MIDCKYIMSLFDLFLIQIYSVCSFLLLEVKINKNAEYRSSFFNHIFTDLFTAAEYKERMSHSITPRRHLQLVCSFETDSMAMPM